MARDTSTAQEPKRHSARRRSRGLPLSLVVVGGVIGLMVVAMTLVIGLSFAAGLRNTTDLLIVSSRFLVEALEGRIVSELAPAALLAETVASSAAAVLDNTAEARSAGAITANPVLDLVAGAMAVLPQAAGIVLVEHPPGVSFGRAVLMLRDGTRMRADSRLLVLLEELSRQQASPEMSEGRVVWGRPVHVGALGATVLPVAVGVPAADGGRVEAMVLVGLDGLSTDSSQVHFRGGRAFVLYGQEHLLTVERQQVIPGDTLAAVPLPRLAEQQDPVFRALAAGRGQPLYFDTRSSGFEGRYLDLESDTASDLEDMLGMASENYVVLTRQIAGFTPTPLTAGIYFRDEDISTEVNRLSRAALAALGVLVVAAVLAYLLSILITRPVRLFAANARRVAELRLDGLDFGKGQPSIREFRDATDAFRRMVNALRWFEAYVPRTLVQELIQNPGSGANRSEERLVTVMFTDIRGFTALAERMPARDAAELLNAHFELVIACVEAEGGTVDKFIGDSVMCFWGAPQRQEDHAARAMRAARAIRLALAADNRARRAAGGPPVAVRLGVHSGRAIVGNIGSRSRVNYTLVGDVVNIANRLESLGKNLAPEEEVCILASDAVLGHCGGGFAFAPCGAHALRGREGMVQVYALL